MMRWAICLMMLAMMFVMNGCGGGGGGGQPPPPSVDKTPPEISNPDASPRKLRFLGGEVTISAVVIDPSGVERVWAVVQNLMGHLWKFPFRLLAVTVIKGCFKLEATREMMGNCWFIVFG